MFLSTNRSSATSPLKTLATLRRSESIGMPICTSWLRVLSIRRWFVMATRKTKCKRSSIDRNCAFGSLLRHKVGSHSSPARLRQGGPGVYGHEADEECCQRVVANVQPGSREIGLHIEDCLQGEPDSPERGAVDANGAGQRAATG